MSITDQPYKTIGEWIHRTFSFESVGIEAVKSAFIEAIHEHRFKVKEEIIFEDGFELKAIYGNKAKALFVGSVIPFGKHLPWGKRFFLRARLKSVADNTEIQIEISPYMELLDSEEIGFITQDVSEKFTDDYMAASKLHSIAQSTYDKIDVETPLELHTFERKKAVTDVLLNVLIYPVDGYKRTRPIYIAPERNRTWSWGAFVLPQLWFLYYDAWGVAALSLFIDFMAYAIGFYIGSVLLELLPPIVCIIAGLIIGFLIMLISHSLFALNFEKIHYMRHGHWKNEVKE